MSTVSTTDKLILAGAGVALLWLWSRGTAGVVSDVAQAAGGAAAGAVTGVVTGVSEGFHIPTPADISSDPAVARWILDHPKGGYWEASFWVSPAALARGAWMDAGTGTPPPAGTKAYTAFPPAAGVSGGIDFGNPGGW